MNGVPTDASPAVGALLKTDQLGSLYTNCTATLIGCDTVLTAAHCFCTKDDGTETLEPAAQCVSSGLAESVRAQSIFALQNAGPFTIKSVAIHPDFQPVEPMGTLALVGDLAVLKLDTATTGIPPARINTQGEVPTGTAATIVGFGETGLKVNDTGLKRSGSVTTAPCIDPTDGKLKDRLVCWNFDEPIGPAGEDSTICHGDSGGPLFVDLDSGLRLAGVTSGGYPGICDPGDINLDPDVYSYREWITQQAGTDLSSGRCGDIPQLGEEGAQSMSFLGVLSIVHPEDTYAVEIPTGVAEVRFALNGDDQTLQSANNDFDLLVKAGAPPTIFDYDCWDSTVGPYGFCPFTTPASGTWYVTALLQSGLGAYQVTATTFLAEAAPTATLTPTPTSTLTATPTPHPATPTRTESPTRVPTATRTSTAARIATATRSATPAAPTATMPPTNTTTPTGTATRLPPVTQTPAATRTATVTSTPGFCSGDCNDDGIVTVAEVIVGVNIALGSASPDTCSAFDPDGTGRVTVDGLIRAINSLLNGCRRAPTALPSASPTAVASATMVATPSTTPTLTRQATPTRTPEDSPTWTPMSTATVSVTPTPSGSVTATATTTPTAMSTATTTDSAAPTATCPAAPIPVASSVIPEGGYSFTDGGGEYELATLATTAQPLAGCNELSVTVALSATSTAGHITLRLSTDGASDIVGEFTINDEEATSVGLQGDYPGLAPGRHGFRVFATIAGEAWIPLGYLQVQSP